MVRAHPRAWLAGVALATIPFAFGLARLQLRTGGEALYPAANAVIDSTAADRERFHDPDAVIVLVTAREPGATIFSVEGLGLIARLTQALGRVPGVRAEDASSLATAVDVTASAERIQLRRVLDPPPRTPAEAAGLRRRLDYAGLYDGLLYGRDGRSASIVLPIEPGIARAGVVHRLREVAANLSAPGVEVRLTGPVVAEVLLGEQILADLVRLVPIVVVIVLALLAIFLRSPAGAVIPLLQTGAVMTWTFGAMGLFGVPLTLVTSVLPVLLMAMAVTDQIHVIERVQHHLGAEPDVAHALQRAYSEIGRPIVRVALTTALGFLAFTTASVPAMRSFGLFACLGLLLSLAFTFTLVPAALLVIPRRWLRTTPVHASKPLRGLEGWAAQHPRRALLAGCSIVLLAATGMAKLRVEDSWIDNFDPRSDLATAARAFDASYRGSYRLDAVLEAADPDWFRSARGMRLVDSVQTELSRLPEVGGTQSIADLARAVLHGVAPARSIDTVTDAGIVQLLVMLDMSGGGPLADRFLDPSGRECRIRCFVGGADYTRARRLIARADSIAVRLERSTGVRMRLSGDLAVATQVVRATVDNQLRSVAATTLGLAVLLALSFSSIALAGIALLPIVATTLAVLGGMGYASVTLGVATSMFAAMVEGEGINYTIHVVSRFVDLRANRPSADALRDTLAAAGPAIRGNGIALVAGCLVLCMSSLQPVRHLGALLATGMSLSYILTFLMLPALLLGRRSREAVRHRSGFSSLPIVLLALVAGLAIPSSVIADATPPRRDDPAARALMREVAALQRGSNRLFAMDIALTVGDRMRSDRRILGVAGADAHASRVLYVYSWPATYRGMALVTEDGIGSAARGRVWLSMPALGSFREVDAPSLPLLVPGTGMTYEDARGWIDPAKFAFAFVDRGRDEVTLDASAVSDSVAALVGCRRLKIRIDARRRVVTGVEFNDAAGRLLRTFEANDFVRIGRGWYPTSVRTSHFAQHLRANILYQYAAVAPPPMSLFRFDSTASFIDRLGRWRDRMGNGRELPDTLEVR